MLQEGPLDKVAIRGTTADHQWPESPKEPARACLRTLQLAGSLRKIRLPPNAEALNKRFVTLWTAVFQIFEQFAALRDHC